MERKKELTDAQKIELWKKCGWKRRPDMDYIDNYVIRYVWEYDGSTDRLPPTDLNNLEKYAWPVAVKKLQPEPEWVSFAIHTLCESLKKEILQGYSLTDALALVCYEVICGK